VTKWEFLKLSKRLGLARDRSFRGLPGVALRGLLDGAPVFIAQYAMAVGRDPRPRPFTELRVERASPWRGALFGASAGSRGDTGDPPFDGRFRWMPHPNVAEGARPIYLSSPRVREALITLDAAIAGAVGHHGIVVFQVDHLETATRMMILTHLPQAELLEKALRLLVEMDGQ